MSSYSGSVISPITTIVGTDATIENNLVALNGLTSTAELYANYMENNNTNLAKLAQLFYASIKDTAITSSVKTRIGTDFDATIDTNVSMLIDNIVTNIATKASTKSFLISVKNFDGNVSDIESELNTSKSMVNYSYTVANRLELDQLLKAWDGNYSVDPDSNTTKDLEKKIASADISGVHTLQDLFDGLVYSGDFNVDISGRDTSGVVNMARAFKDAESFNQDIGGWDVSSLTVLIGSDSMFTKACAFNQYLALLDLSGGVNSIDNIYLKTSTHSEGCGFTTPNWESSNYPTF